MNKLWKEAASIIVACRSNAFKAATTSIKGTRPDANNKLADFKLLVLRRGKTSSFFPGGYVFPGGTIEQADTSEEWLEHFGAHGVRYDDLQKLDRIDASRASIFNTEAVSKVPRSVALRITAVRETFEESGVLLCKPDNVDASSWSTYLTDFKLKEWQGLVQNKASEFLTLCKTFNCVPDIWSLHLWSNWLTPTNNPIRFDTAFFLATLDQPPPAFMNEKEMDDIKWHTPTELLRGCEEATWLPPPQYYEVSRINSFLNIDELNSHAVKRTKEGCERWMTIQVKADNGIICYLPGDDEYPRSVDITAKGPMQKIEGAMENLRINKKKLNRMELYGEKGTRIMISNVDPQCGHVLPFVSHL